VTLALTLLYEMSQPDSTWKAFLALLPPTLSTPLFYKEEEINALSHSNLATRLTEHRNSIVGAHKALFGPMQSVQPEVVTEVNFGLDRFQWALSIVWSRSHYFIDEGEPALALLPFVTQFNHGIFWSNAEVENRLHEKNNATEGFAVVVTVDALRDEEVRISYGQRTTEDLLLYYGFAPEAHTPLPARPASLRPDLCPLLCLCRSTRMTISCSKFKSQKKTQA